MFLNMVQGILCFAFAFFVQTYCIRLKGPIFAAMFNPTSTILVAILEPLILHVKYRLGRSDLSYYCSHVFSKFLG